MFINRDSSSRLQSGWKILSIIVLVGLLLSGCTAPKAKVYRVGILCGLNYVADIGDGFKAKMADLGYAEGKNIVYDVQKTDFDMAAYKRILKKFVDDKVDLIVVWPTEATLEAKAAVKDTNIPVLFTFALVDGMGIIDSVREPGGNITGVRYPGPDIVLKRYEILRQIAPAAKRIYVPYQKGYPIVNPQLEALRAAVKADGVTLVEAPASTPAELAADLKSHSKSDDPGFDAILLIVEPLTVTPEGFTSLAVFAYDHKMPFGGAYAKMEGYGSIFGVNVNNVETGKQAAPLADKILKGTKAGTIPVVSSESFIQIDNKVAQDLGVTIPEGLLQQANQVIR